jgi:hypothetical protein
MFYAGFGFPCAAATAALPFDVAAAAANLLFCAFILVAGASNPAAAIGTRCCVACAVCMMCSLTQWPPQPVAACASVASCVAQPILHGTMPVTCIALYKSAL